MGGMETVYRALLASVVMRIRLGEQSWDLGIRLGCYCRLRVVYSKQLQVSLHSGLVVFEMRPYFSPYQVRLAK